MKVKIVFLLFLFPIACFSQLDSLKGKIKKVTDSMIYSDNYYFVLSLKEIDFGQHSLLEEDLFTGFKGDLLPKRFSQFNKERKFDKKGRLVELTNIYPKINSSFTTFYAYDEYNNLIQEKNEYGDGNYAATNYHYRPLKDSLDHLTVEISYNSDPDRFEMKQYFYDNKAKLTEVRDLSSFGWDRKKNYKYDSAGRLIAEIISNITRVLKYDSIIKSQTFQDSITDYYQENFSYYKDGSLKEKSNGCTPKLVSSACQRTIYIYDNKKRKSKVFYYWKGTDSLFSHKEYEYYPDNLVKKISWFYKEETNPKNIAEYFYTNKELAKAVLTTIDKTTVIEFKYKVDLHNNWVEQTKVVDNSLMYTRKREITYWD